MELIQAQEGTQNKWERIHCRALKLNQAVQDSEIIRFNITNHFMPT